MTRNTKAVLGAVALASATLLFAGCAGNAGSTPTTGTDLELTDEDVTLRFTWWGSDARAEITNEAIEAFEAEHENVTIEGEFRDFTTYWDALATATAGGDSPDIIQMDELYLASYADRGALFDLGTAANLLDTSELDESSLGTGKVNDTLYGVPNGIVGYGILANVDLFEEYGVDLPDDTTWTWDDVASVAEELTEKSNGAIAGSGQLGGFDAGSIKYWARAAGGELFDADGNVSLDPQVLVDLWDFNLGLIDSGAAESASAMVEGQAAGVAGSSLATNKVALGVGYSNQISTYESASGAEFAILQLPQPESGDPNFLKPSQFWTISSQSEHPAEAAAFVDFLLNSEEAASILQAERGIPANNAMREYLEADLTPADQKAIAFLDSVSFGEAPPVTPNGGSGVEGILQRHTQEVFFGQVEPAAAAEAFIAELQGEIDAAR